MWSVAFFATLKELENEFGLEIDAEKEWPKEFKARYNIAPSQKIPTITREICDLKMPVVPFLHSVK